MEPSIRNKLATVIIFTAFFTLFKPCSVSSQSAIKDTIIQEKLLYHTIHLNATDQTILPWYSTDLGKSYDFAISRGLQLSGNGMSVFEY